MHDLFQVSISLRKFASRTKRLPHPGQRRDFGGRGGQAVGHEAEVRINQRAEVAGMAVAQRQPHGGRSIGHATHSAPDRRVRQHPVLGSARQRQQLRLAAPGTREAWASGCFFCLFGAFVLKKHRGACG
jgi:hypothetical protein